MLPVLSRTSHGYSYLLLGHSYYMEVTKNVSKLIWCTYVYAEVLFHKKSKNICIKLIVLGCFSV